MTDAETITKQQETIERLKRKIKRLENRLRDKQKYETGLLVATGATPAYITKIHNKDDEALSG